MIDYVFVRFEKRFEIRSSRNVDLFLGMTVEDGGNENKLYNQPMTERV